MENNLSDIIRRIERLEKAVFAPARGGLTKEKEISGKSILSNKIVALRDSGFFTKSKTISDVHTKLQPTYDCELNRVAVGLLRLSKRKLLRVTSREEEGKRLKAYVW